MVKSRKCLVLLLMITLALIGCSEDDNTVTPPAEVPDLAYVGSDRCAECHATEFANWAESGHPYKLTKIEGEAPTALFPSFSGYPNMPVDPPAGYDWSDISYTIGGYGWKMRWIDDDGYIITGIHENQYNFENDTWADYHFSDPTGTKKYNCGKCHTTGWVASDDEIAENNQDGLEGLVGTFFAGGVHCEACHGMGSQHAFSQNIGMTVDVSSDLCGRCHMRNAEHHIAASGGFIQHHEQFDEWTHSPHNSATGPGCVDCHDPHSSVKYDTAAAGTGTTTSCTDCHTVEMKHNGFPNCLDCHMPMASKSAIVNMADYQGDIKTHIWKINTAAVNKTDGFFDAAGTLVQEDADGLAAVTLDFACYSCHGDGAGGGGTMSAKTLQQLSDYVLGVGEYAGTGGIHSPTR